MKLKYSRTEITMTSVSSQCTARIQNIQHFTWRHSHTASTAQSVPRSMDPSSSLVYKSTDRDTWRTDQRRGRYGRPVSCTWQHWTGMFQSRLLRSTFQPAAAAVSHYQSASPGLRRSKLSRFSRMNPFGKSANVLSIYTRNIFMANEELSW